MRLLGLILLTRRAHADVVHNAVEEGRMVGRLEAKYGLDFGALGDDPRLPEVVDELAARRRLRAEREGRGARHLLRPS